MRTILALLMVGAMLTLGTSAGLAADPPVDGSVTQKFISRGDDGSFRIAVNGAPYEVPREFYLVVQVGDTVHFDGTHWTITVHSQIRMLYTAISGADIKFTSYALPTSINPSS